MTTQKITCENCGFEEELTAGQLEERANGSNEINCKQCEAKIPLPQNAEKQDDSKNSDTSAKDKSENAASGADAQQEDAEPTKADAAKESAKQAAEAAKQKLKEAIAEGRKNPVFVANLLSAGLKKLAGKEGEKQQSCKDKAITIGHYALLLGAVFCLVMGIVIAVRTFTLTPLWLGIFTAAALLFAQYLAIKSFALLDGYIEKNPSKMPGDALLEILSAISMFAALLILIFTATITITELDPVFVGVGLASVIGLYYLSGAYIRHDSQLNISIDANMPASLIIVELVAAQIKALLIVLPYLFGLGTAIMAAMVAWPALSTAILGLTPYNSYNLLFQLTGLLFCAFSPIILYSIILLYSFIVEVARGLLKLAKLK